MPQADYISDPESLAAARKRKRRMADQVADLSAKASMMKLAEEV